MTNSDQLTNILMIVLMMAIILLVILICVFIFVKFKMKNQKEKNNKEMRSYDETTNEKILVAKNYTKDSIFNFMEFDKIEDNMIIQKDGSRYLMVVQCQGVNYDLMSVNEKIGVEEGFLQFLNTLRHPIQLYVQTRTVNLEDSVNTYKKKLKEFDDKLEKLKLEYQQMINAETYSKEELDRMNFDITRQKNLCEYAKDIISNTEKMSLNKNVLNKQYYVVVPHYPEDLGNNNFDKEELKNMAFSELYTKSQSIIRTLSACGINARILTSNELVDLLYVAYNRDEAEVFGIKKAMAAGYEEVYSTAPDVLDKKMRALDKQIKDKAIEYANEKILEVKSEKQKKVEEKQSNISKLMMDMAQLILEENRNYVGKDTADRAIDKIQEDKKKIEKEEKGEEKDVQKETRTRKRRTKKAE